MSKFKLGDYLYFIYGGTSIAKGQVDELINHYTKDKVIVKYIVRPTGLDKFITLDEANVYANLEDAKTFVKEVVTNMYEVSKDYLENLTENSEQFRDDIKKES